MHVTRGQTALVLRVVNIVTLADRQVVQLHNTSVNMVERLRCWGRFPCHRRYRLRGEEKTT